MILLTENDKFHICNCGCHFVWNPNDIQQTRLGPAVVCPQCAMPIIVVIADIKLQNPPIEGEINE